MHTSRYCFDVEMQYISEVLRQTKQHGREAPVERYVHHSNCIKRKTFHNRKPRNMQSFALNNTKHVDTVWKKTSQITTDYIRWTSDIELDFSDHFILVTTDQSLPMAQKITPRYA